jgi:hypothetical protein
MNWKQFSDDYKYLVDEYNLKDYNDRLRISRLMNREAIAELIRSKDYLQKAMQNIDARIRILANAIEEDDVKLLECVDKK